MSRQRVAIGSTACKEIQLFVVLDLTAEEYRLDTTFGGVAGVRVVGAISDVSDSFVGFTLAVWHGECYEDHVGVGALAIVCALDPIVVLLTGDEVGLGVFVTFVEGWDCDG